MARTIFATDKKYTFSDYYDFTNPSEEIANALGYSLSTEILNLPIVDTIDLTAIRALQKDFYTVLPKITLNSEIAKRGFMIAPILWQVIRHVNAKINVEYCINVNNKLSGCLDYLLCSKQQLIIIEAKKGDLEKGFNQLLSELIALDIYENEITSDLIYGAISIGELWRFAILKRNVKHVTKDLHTYRIPEDIETIFLALTGILQV